MHRRISIHLKGKANIDLSDPNIGFQIKDAGGTIITGTNTKIKRVKLGPYKKGQTFAVTWTIDNIFKDGTYYIEPAIIGDISTGVSDWWSEATDFAVFSGEHIPYLVNPSIDTKAS